MSHSFPPDLQRFVSEEISTGKYASEQELVIEAVRLLQNNEHLSRFKAQLAARNQQISRGYCIELADDAALDRFFDEMEAESDAELNP